MNRELCVSKHSLIALVWSDFFGILLLVTNRKQYSDKSLVMENTYIVNLNQIQYKIFHIKCSQFSLRMIASCSMMFILPRVNFKWIEHVQI